MPCVVNYYMFDTTTPQHDLYILKKNPEPLTEFVCDTV